MSIVRLFGLTIISFMAASTAWAAGPVKLEVGISGAATDVGFFIADKKGYFRDQGIAVNFTNFDTAAKMVAPLGTGQLDIGGGGPSAGLYNAIARGVDIKIVAEKGATPPGHGFQPLMIRKDLIDSGRFKSLADLKGLKIAISAPGSGSSTTLNEAAKKGGISFKDVETTYLSFSQQVLALSNKAIDGSFTTEPNATEAEKRGVGVRFMGDDVIYPNHQVAVVLFSGSFIKSKPDVAQHFINAYVHALRDYNDALNADGKLAGPQSDEVVSILTEYSDIKDPATYHVIVPPGMNPDGYVNIPTLANDLEFFKQTADTQGNVTIDQVVDNSFVDAAVKEFGHYKPKNAK
ncbi:MAG TPA: ABC transporter substrate-binding protein [Beijerinckiaceae bacterium]|nr:ABC transporter substrate-binding protein [Beijerinckiaceae bacterium]